MTGFLKKISAAALAVLTAASLCACSGDNVRTDDIISMMQENSDFEFYYKSETAALRAKSQKYKILYLSYDLNDDGNNEDICALVTDGDETELDIFDTSNGANIGAKTKIDFDGGYKVQVLKHKTKGYCDIKYVTLDKNGNPSDSVIIRMTVENNSGYYSEAKK